MFDLLISRHSGLLTAFLLVIGLSISACDSAETLDDTGDFSASAVDTSGEQLLGTISDACYSLNVYGPSSIPVGNTASYYLQAAPTDAPGCGTIICSPGKTLVKIGSETGADVMKTASSTCTGNTTATLTVQALSSDYARARVEIIGQLGYWAEPQHIPTLTSESINVAVTCSSYPCGIW